MQLIIDERWRARNLKDAFLAVLQGGLLIIIQTQCSLAFTDLTLTKLPPDWQHGWRYGYVGHAIDFLVAMAIILILRPFLRGSFGLRWPRAKTYVWPALWIGALIGVLMLMVDYFPDLVRHHAPEGLGSTALSNMVPWLLMQGVFVGITEESVFRSLLLGYLINRLPTPVGFGRFKVSAAGVLTAFIFAWAHADAFWHTTLIAAIGQQIYVVACGLFYAYLFERSGSVLAPVIAHNAGDFVEYSITFMLRAVWPT